MKLAGLAALAAAVAGALVLAFQPFSSDGPHVRSPLDVVGAFVYQLDHGNFGKACGLMSQKARRGKVEDCSAGLAYNAGVNMVFFGGDIFDGMTVVPGSQKQLDDGSVTFKIKSDLIPPVLVTVAKQDNGRYRITKIG